MWKWKLNLSFTELSLKFKDWNLLVWSFKHSRNSAHLSELLMNWLIFRFLDTNMSDFNTAINLYDVLIISILIIYKFIHCKMNILQVLPKRNVLFAFLYIVNLLLFLNFAVNRKHHQDVSRKATNQHNLSWENKPNFFHDTWKVLLAVL